MILFLVRLLFLILEQHIQQHFFVFVVVVDAADDVVVVGVGMVMVLLISRAVPYRIASHRQQNHHQHNILRFVRTFCFVFRLGISQQL